MPRFFIPTEQCTDSTVRIVGEDARHIARSLRMAVGDTVTVCDGEGRVYECRLSHIRDEEVLGAVENIREGDGEPPYRVTVYMAYPKGDKLETVIQKAVELGASRIVPFVSERCVKLPKADRADAKQKRLSRIAEEAAKQCGRSRLPTVGEPLSFADMLREGVKAPLALFCYEGERAQSLRAVLSGLPCPTAVSVVIGSEGGFSEAEARAAREAGFLSVHLGARILRCETAPSYVLSALSYAYEMAETDAALS